MLADDPVDRDGVFGFRHDKGPSQMATGQRAADPASIGNLLNGFRITKRGLNDETIETLQYIQKVNLIFHGIEWLHMAMNTLINQPCKFLLILCTQGFYLSHCAKIPDTRR